MESVIAFFVQFFHIIWSVCVEVALDVGTDPAILAAVAGAIVMRTLGVLAAFAIPAPFGPVIASIVQLGIPKLLTRFAALIKARRAKKLELPPEK